MNHKPFSNGMLDALGMVVVPNLDADYADADSEWMVLDLEESVLVISSS